MKNKFLLFAFITSVVFIFGCSATSLMSSWGFANGNPLKSTLVISIMGKQYPHMGPEMEQYAVSALRNRGIDAISATQKYGASSYDSSALNALREKVQADGFDNVITITVQDKDKTVNYVPGYYSSAYAGGWYDWYGFYHTRYFNHYEPGHYESNVNWILGINIFDAKQHKMVYSCSTSSVNPGSAANLTEGVTVVFINDLQKRGFLSASKK